MGRTKRIERKTTLSVTANLSGWLEFMGRNYGRGAGEYLCDLAERDRAQTIAHDPGEAERYRAFLVGAGYDAELASLGVEYDSTEAEA